MLFTVPPKLGGMPGPAVKVKVAPGGALAPKTVTVEANAGRACPSTEARASASTKKPRRTGRRVLVMAGASHA